MARNGWLVLAVAAAMGILVACQRATPPAAPPSEPGREEAEASEGHTLFAAKGCATCHGQNGEGTAAGPALAGHTEEQVVRQVRTPRGAMPRFGPELVGEAELHEIAHYVASLSGAHGHE